jgi:hypothetical protein
MQRLNHRVIGAVLGCRVDIVAPVAFRALVEAAARRPMRGAR